MEQVGLWRSVMKPKFMTNYSSRWFALVTNALANDWRRGGIHG
jgi:hypothetical protein